MADEPSIYDPVFDEARDHDGFRVLRSRVGRQVGAERVGLSLWELPPGEAAYPYHFHLREEEVVIVLEGAPTLRGPGGWRTLEAGAVVRFAPDESGAHQFVNRSSERVRLLAVSTNAEPDLVVYPDSGKLGACERLPDGGGVRAFFRLDSAVDYWDGETPPSSG